jgi:hypothetical protein
VYVCGVCVRACVRECVVCVFCCWRGHVYVCACAHVCLRVHALLNAAVLFYAACIAQERMIRGFCHLYDGQVWCSGGALHA